MTAWPASLPQSPLRAGFAQEQIDNSVRSAMSYGPDKVRRRTTSAVKSVVMAMVLTQSQVAALETFYNTTIQVTGTVDWIDHISGAAAEYRFMKPPAYSQVTKDTWTASLNFEILP